MKSITRYALIALSLLAVTKPVKAMEYSFNDCANVCKNGLIIYGTILGGVYISASIVKKTITIYDRLKLGMPLSTAIDAQNENMLATLEALKANPNKSLNKSLMFQKYLKKQREADFIFQLGQIAWQDQREKLISIIKLAPFNPKNTISAESLKRIQAFLLVLNRKKEDHGFKLPREVKQKILSYLPDCILSENHFRTLTVHGSDYKTLVETYPYEWFLHLADDLTGTRKKDLIETLTPYIVDYSLCNLKNLFEQRYYEKTPQEVALHHGHNALAVLLDPEKVDQHRDILTKHIRNELSRGRTSISSDNLPKRFKSKQQKCAKLYVSYDQWLQKLGQKANGELFYL